MLLLIAHVLLLTAHRSLLIAHKIASLSPISSSTQIKKHDMIILNTSFFTISTYDKQA